MTTGIDATWEQVDALDAGRAFLDRSADHKLVVRGPDARRWLGDLVTADVETLERSDARRSLLLSATGRIRADFWIAAEDAETFLLLQPAAQPAFVGDMLRPYVLSSAVRLDDVTTSRSALVLRGPNEIVAAAREDLLDVVRAVAGRGYRRVAEGAWEVWRVGRGDPRMGADFGPGDLPAEAGLERLIDLAKGCFLGQESVAKVRNLGHPPTVLRHLLTRTRVVAPGTPVLDAGGVVGRVTSVAPARNGATVLIARVSWTAAERALTAYGGAELVPIAN
jgi:folate-binding protein YgfZ